VVFWVEVIDGVGDRKFKKKHPWIPVGSLGRRGMVISDRRIDPEISAKISKQWLNMIAGLHWPQPIGVGYHAISFGILKIPFTIR